MFRSRLIPIILIENRGLYKSIKFKNHRYLGDPLNTIRLFNDKEVDELVILDIGARKSSKGIDFEYLEKLSAECFMPVCYGGGVDNILQVEKLFKLGFEKISFNTALDEKIGLVKEVAKKYGVQSVVASIDVKKNIFGKYNIYIENGTKKTKWNLEEYLKHLQDNGAGEILLTSIDQEGTMTEYDYDLIKLVSEAVEIPVIANGGAGSLSECKKAIDNGASAAAASSIFSYYGKKKAVLINYPTQKEIMKCLMM